MHVNTTVDPVVSDEEIALMVLANPVGEDEYDEVRAVVATLELKLSRATHFVDFSAGDGSSISQSQLVSNLKAQHSLWYSKILFTQE